MGKCFSGNGGQPATVILLGVSDSVVNFTFDEHWPFSYLKLFNYLLLTGIHFNASNAVSRLVLSEPNGTARLVKDWLTGDHSVVYHTL